MDSSDVQLLLLPLVSDSLQVCCPDGGQELSPHSHKPPLPHWMMSIERQKLIVAVKKEGIVGEAHLEPLGELS